MLYEQPTKKSYYRFPSISSINDYDLKHYYPEKTHASGEDTRFKSQYSNHVSNRETYYDL